MDRDHEVISRMFSGRHALMLINGFPTNAHTGKPAYVPPPGPLHKGHTSHAAPEPDVVEVDLDDTGPIPVNGTGHSAETALDTLSGFRWREGGK